MVLSAVWDPKHAECFVLASPKKPYRLNEFHESGKWLHSFIDEDHLSTQMSPPPATPPGQPRWATAKGDCTSSPTEAHPFYLIL